jgi:fructose-bisphosphate aldolase class I
MVDESTIKLLQTTAKAMVASSKGILAADESFGTIEKRFAKINLPSTEENRRAYREMLFTTPRLGDYISGVIMFDETIRQKVNTPPYSPPILGGERSGIPQKFFQNFWGAPRGGKDGQTFVSVLEKAGVLPGIKVDQGTVADPASPEEKITKGLAGLAERLKEYVALGAKFAKWRAVITIAGDLPTPQNIAQNAQDLAQYSLLCQQAGLVPMVEPEVLMDGRHTMDKCEEVSEQVLSAVFEELNKAGVDIGGVILKTNMVIPGKDSGQQASSGEIAAATIRLFKKVLPAELPGEAFLSGGQSELEATENLDAINKLHPSPWQISFSYGRALQNSALLTWQGKAANVKAAQEKFLHRARMNSLARDGKYSSSLEHS